MIAQSFSLSKKLLKARLVPMLGLFIVGTFLNLYSENSLGSLGQYDESMKLYFQISLGLWEMVEGLFIFLLLTSAIPEVLNLKSETYLRDPLTKENISAFFAEYLRMMAQVLLWGLLLIIPGFIRYCRLVFVPYITLFSRSYVSGEVDALELSDKLTSKLLGTIITFMIVTSLIQITIEFTPHLVDFLQVLPIRILFFALGYALSTFCYSYIFLLFSKSIEDHIEEKSV